MTPVNPYYVLFTALGIVFSAGLAWGALGGRVARLEEDAKEDRRKAEEDRRDIGELQRFESSVDARLTGIEKGIETLTKMVSRGQTI